MISPAPHRANGRLPGRWTSRGTDLATLIDDAEALDAIVQALAVRDPARSASLLTDTQWKRGAHLTDVLMFAGPGGSRRR